MVASSGTIKREGAVISNRIPSMDSVAVLAAKRFPQLFTESAKTDSLTIVFALDTLGQVMMTASLPVPLQSWVSSIPRVEQIFLDIPQQEVKYGEWRSGTITARGFPSKTMSLLFVVFGRK